MLKICRSLVDFNYCPILRKDFIFDPYQILESRSIGADVVLLIAAMLSVEQAKELVQAAHELELEVLLEVHSFEEWEAFKDIGADILGFNSRNLHDFSVDLDRAFSFISKLQTAVPVIAESGVTSAKAVSRA